MKLGTREAVCLFHEGTLALADVEAHGVRVDVPYVEGMIKKLDSEILELEKRLQSSKIWRKWTKAFGMKSKLGSKEQLGEILFKIMELPCSEYTPSSYESDGTLKENPRPKADKATILATGLPFAQDYIRREELRKANSTYLKGLLREVTPEGRVHPEYTLNLIVSYRSGCKRPNFQNQPARNPEIAAMIRKCFLPDKGDHFGELDFSGIEVKVAYCWHKDPVMRDYLNDPKSDMHRDQAVELFMLSQDFLIQNKDWAKKCVRDWAKNRWVFPQFYGSVYFQCAPHIWEAIELKDAEGKYFWKLPDGTPIRKYLRKKGIKELGDCSSQNKHPKQGTFVKHCQDCERKLLNKRFKVYAQWKRDMYEKYKRDLGYTTLTGFRIQGVLKRNEVVNYGIQGDAFHCDLWSVIKLNKWLRKHKMKTKIIGEVHDSIDLTIHPKEAQDVLNKAHEIMTVDLLKEWKWIITPMETESELSPVGESWYAKRVWERNSQGVWREKGK